MKEKVLITGASGFLGFHLIEAALGKNMEVYAGVRKSSDVRHLAHLPISFTYPDYSSLNSLTEDIREKKYDYIIHAAGTTKAKTEARYNEINADYTFNLALAVQQAGIPIKRFVYISSLAALGPLENINEVIDESTIPNPVTSYGKSKLLSETRLRQLSIPLVILRPTAIYGPREKDIFLMFKFIKRGLELYIGKNEQRLSFIYVKDMADAAIRVLTNANNSIYNLSDGNSYTRYDLANYLKLLMKKKTLKFHLSIGLTRLLAKTLEKADGILGKTPVINEDKLNEIMGKNWVCSIEKAKKELNFNPLFNLEKGLVESLKWYQQWNWL
ncbi:MAG TPA: NAD(P)-dependent oxidoreductase [Hanamia sp.]|jgi:Nucleoside-diphosphate-sugar epimerases|nr:NAD(P)-dependent oxidoreductase [Hanamia sp.]